MKQIPLTRNKVALVDDADYPSLMERTWCYSGHGYAYTKELFGYKGKQSGVRRKGRTISMHRLIMDVGPGIEVDHKNMNGLDNRRANLRAGTRSLNMANSSARGGTSKYKGVHWIRADKKWRAAITVNYKTIVIGRFASEDEAAAAYNEAAIEHFGEFARLNDVPQHEGIRQQ